MGAILGRAPLWDSSDGVFGRVDLASLLQLPHLQYLFVIHYTMA